MSFQPGKTLVGRYQLSESIGGGAMGEVFKAEHTLMKKTVAIKLLHASASNNQELVERFRREAQSAATIQHPNICSVTDFDVTEDGTFFLVMEYLDGETLQVRLRRVGSLDPLTIIHIMTQLLSVLQSAHARGIVHRDIKPENIFLIQQDGKPDYVKLLDFGIARQSETATANSANTNLTQAGFIYGTPQYMAPEQAAGGTIDFRADLYACGVILYEMITGKAPFISDNIVKLLSMQSFDPPPHLESDAIEHASQFNAIIQKLLAKDRTERFQSAGEVAKALETIKNDLSGSLPAAPLMSEETDGLSKLLTVLPVKHTRRLILILATSCAILLVALFIVMYDSDDALPQPPPTAEPTVVSQPQEDDAPLAVQDLPQPFGYDEKYQVSSDVVLSKDRTLISAAEDLFAKKFEAALEKLSTVHDKYDTHPNFMRLYVLTLYELKRYDETLNALDKLLTLVPDALRNKSIQEVVFTLINRKDHFKPTMDVLQNHASTEAAIGLSEAIMRSPFNRFEVRKARLREVFEAMPQDDIPEWRRQAVQVWTMPKDRCSDRLRILTNVAASDIPPQLLLDILTPITIDKECKGGRFNQKVDCNACMLPWVRNTVSALKTQLAASPEVKTPD